MNKEKLIELIREIGIEGARYIEENIDLQFFAIKNLYGVNKDPEAVIKLTLLNSIVSYQLNCTGENWWIEFSNYFLEKEVKDLIEDYSNFLTNSKCNKRFLKIKLNRIKKLEKFINNLTLDKTKYYYENMVTLREDLSFYLNSDKSSKTICFTVKMFGYASRIVFNKFIPYPFEIDIPLDKRIINYTKKFTNKRFIEFWREISNLSKVPPLHIDSILWPFLNDSNTNLIEKLRNFNKSYLIFSLLE